jgi:hypothetical protein
MNHFRSAALKIKRVLVPVLILVLVAAAAFWLTGCHSLQLLNAMMPWDTSCWQKTILVMRSYPTLGFYVPQKVKPNNGVVYWVLHSLTWLPIRRSK